MARSGWSRRAAWCAGCPSLVALVGGSLVIGFGIGLAGVLLAGVVKEHLGGRAGAATGGYTVTMMVGATAASALAVPLAVLLGGWSYALAALAVPAVLAIAVWWPIARAHPARVGAPACRAAPVPWRDPFARLASCYMAGTSMMFYGWITWLAPYYERQGWSAQQAGLLLAVWSIGADARRRCCCRRSPSGAGAGGSGPASRWAVRCWAPSGRCWCRSRRCSGRPCGRC